MNTNTFLYSTYINTTPEKLWQSLTSPEFTNQYWSGRKMQSDWKVGSPVTLIMDNGKVDWEGKVLTYDPTTTLAYSFHFVDNKSLAPEPHSRVRFDLEQIGPTMKLTVIHDELTESVYNDISQGWPGILSSLKSLLETGKSLPSHEM